VIVHFVAMGGIVDYHCSFCCYGWNCWLSLLRLSFQKMLKYHIFTQFSLLTKVVNKISLYNDVIINHMKFQILW